MRFSQIDGNREQLEGKLQERYGYAKDQARKQVNDWLDRRSAAKNGLLYRFSGPFTRFRDTGSCLWHVARPGRRLSRAAQVAPRDSNGRWRCGGAQPHGPLWKRREV
jgi:hypothetical protein